MHKLYFTFKAKANHISKQKMLMQTWKNQCCSIKSSTHK